MHNAFTPFYREEITLEPEITLAEVLFARTRLMLICLMILVASLSILGASVAHRLIEIDQHIAKAEIDARV